MNLEIIKCNPIKTIKQILFSIAILSLMVYMIYFNIWNINEYRMFLAAAVGYGIYLVFKDFEILWNFKKPIIEIDSDGFIDYDSIYGKIYWKNIESINCVDVYPFLILYKETKVVVHLKSKRSAMTHLKNKKVAEKALENNSISINTTKININATNLREKLLKYKKTYS